MAATSDDVDGANADDGDDDDDDNDDCLQTANSIHVLQVQRRVKHSWPNLYTNQSNKYTSGKTGLAMRRRRGHYTAQPPSSCIAGVASSRRWNQPSLGVC